MGTLFMDTTHHGTVATMAMAWSMAREAPMLMPMLMLRLRLRLRLTMPCTARGVLRLRLMLTCTATALAMPTGPTMATTTASRGIENRNQMLSLAALNKLVFAIK